MVKQIIKEAMSQNPLGLKEAVEAELRNRVVLALEAKMNDLEEAFKVGKAGPAKLVSYGPKGDKVTANKIAAHLAKRANDYSGGDAELIKKLSSEISKHGDTTANELIGKHKTIAKNVGMDAKAAHNFISGAASALKESVDLEEAFKVGSKVKVDSEKDDDHGKSGKVVIAKNRAYVVQFADGKRGSFNEDELVNESVDLEEGAKWELSPANYMVGSDLSYDDKLEYTLSKKDSDILNSFLSKASDDEKSKLWKMFWNSKERGNNTAQGPVNAIKYAKAALKESVELDEAKKVKLVMLNKKGQEVRFDDGTVEFDTEKEARDYAVKDNKSLFKTKYNLYVNGENKGTLGEGLEEAKMTDAEVLSAAKALSANGKDAKTKAFGKGLVDFYKKEGSFTPAQVSGLQNIMKNASFQMAKDK